MSTLVPKSKLVELARGVPLINASNNPLDKYVEPDGKVWRRLLLMFRVNFTESAGSGARADALQAIVRGVRFKSNKESRYDGVPGMLAYLIDLMSGQPTAIPTAFAASSAIYIFPYSVWFSDPSLAGRQMDATALDTSSRTDLSLNVALGDVTDLLATVSGDSVSVTVDIYADEIQEALPAGTIRGWRQVAVATGSPQIPTNQQYITLDRDKTRGLKRVVVMETVSSPGRAFSGVRSNAIINDLDVKDGNGFEFEPTLRDVLQSLNQTAFGYPSILSGVSIVDFIGKAKSNGAVKETNVSKLKLEWTNQSGVGGLTTPLVSAGIDCAMLYTA